MSLVSILPDKATPSDQSGDSSIYLLGTSNIDHLMLSQPARDQGRAPGGLPGASIRVQQRVPANRYPLLVCTLSAGADSPKPIGVSLNADKAGLSYLVRIAKNYMQYRRNSFVMASYIYYPTLDWV
jgi:hypothetical protein